MSCTNRLFLEPRCDVCGRWGEWSDKYQCDLCEEHHAERETKDEDDVGDD